MNLPETLLTIEERLEFSIKRKWGVVLDVDKLLEAQDAKTKRVIAEWLMNYIDINLEEIIPDDKYTLFFIPNDKLKAIKKWALGK